ncbi:MAG: GntR family transcriptional regulator [Clostridiales bacterium]|jgi:DNA-binding transcriptional regulator YhcF (GntR family)|nr:GntR family transcriptional regulator [Clostridiales bacterium]
MLIKIDTYAEKPIYEQLRDSIILGIASGELAEGESLPSARNLAADLGVNFHTVNKAYDILRAGGYIVMDRRTTAIVAPKKTQGGISAALAEKLAMCAAEAICNGIDESAFAEVCAESYRKIKGEGISNE